jgi:hypothetical protein
VPYINQPKLSSTGDSLTTTSPSKLIDLATHSYYETNFLQYTPTVGTSTDLLTGQISPLGSTIDPSRLLTTLNRPTIQRASMARSSCLICHEDYGTEAYLYAAVNSDDNKRVCVECLTTMMTRVIKDKDPFPVRVQHPGDLRPLDYQFLDPAMVEKYKQKEMEHRTYPNERVHCGCDKFIGRLVKLGEGETYLAIGTCKAPQCGKRTCLVCATSLDHANLLAAMDDHGCKEKLAAKEADFQTIKNSDERGKTYQLCPTCSRSIQLSEACNHLTCPCGTEFCYLCGKPATGHSGHWDTRPGRCPRYTGENMIAQPQVPRGAIRDVIGRQIALLDFGNDGGEQVDFELAHPATPVNGVEVVNLDDDAAFRFQHVVVDEAERDGYMARRAARDANRNDNRNRPASNVRARDIHRFERAFAELEADAHYDRTMAELEADAANDQAAVEDDELRQGRPVPPPIRAPFAAHDQHRRMVAREDNRLVAPAVPEEDRIHVEVRYGGRRRAAHGLPEQEAHVARTRQVRRPVVTEIRQDALQVAQNNRALAVPPHAQRQRVQNNVPAGPIIPRAPRQPAQNNRALAGPPHAQR